MQADRSSRFGAGGAGALALALVAVSFAGCNDIFNSKTCASQGRLYAPGDAVPLVGGCAGCVCGDNGQIVCAPDHCLPTCEFDETYSYGLDGGLVASRDLATLSPPAAFSFERTPFVVQAAEVKCAPALPACHDAARLDAADIVADLRDPDVQVALALSTPPFYGHDSRPVDGIAFRLLRADGRGFLVGDPCRADEACTPAPDGVQRLVDDLKALEAQQLMDPTCASIPSPGAGTP
jgi:hypothetical protein